MRKIVVDAMAIEKGLNPLRLAVRELLIENKDLELILVGDDSIRILEGERVSIFPSSEVVHGDDSLREILRKRKSSTYITTEILAKGEADSGVSFANTIAVGSFVLRNIGILPGIKKTPLAVSTPSKKAGKYIPTILLDVGATSLDDVSPKNLLEFAILAKHYSLQLGNNHPVIGLLSNGTEYTKGTKVTRKANELFEDYSKESDSFVYAGFVEGRDIFLGDAGKPDIIVTDGYTGNLVLKSAEGAALLYRQGIKDSFNSSFQTRAAGLIAKFSGVFERARGTLNPDQYGATFLGIRKPFVKGHGASNSLAIKNAINLAYTLDNSNQESLIRELKKI